MAYKWKNIVEKNHWIHILFWLLYSIYLFVNPPLYKFGYKPVLYTGVVFYLVYGGAYLFTVQYITPKYFANKKNGKGLLLLLLTACAQQLIFGPLSNYFLPFNNPFLQWFLFNLPFSFIILLLATGVALFTDYLYVVRKVQALELIKAQQEIFLLKSQIKPHFLFNTLNSLYSLARSKSSETETAILQLSNLMRYLTEISQRDFVLVADEIRFLRSYIDMERLRLNDGYICEFDIVTNTYEAYKMPPLLLLPFVENAFKHGAELNPDNIEIRFYLTIQNNTLFFETNNAYVNGQAPVRSGTGLNNIKKRLELIYGNRHSLEIKDINNRFVAKLIIPLL
jgi:signal transduction histidine kinase